MPQAEAQAEIDRRSSVEQALERRIAEQEALYRFTDRLHRADSSAAIYDAALDAMVQSLRCDRASILLYDDAQAMKFVAVRGLSEGYRKAVEGHSPWTPETKNAQPIAVEDIEQADEPPELKATIRNEGIRALLFVPLVAQGRLIGKFMTYYSRPHQFEQDELELALTIARQLSFSILRLRSEAARRATERELQRSEQASQQLAAIVESSDDAIVSKDLTGKIVTWNRAAERLFGFTSEEAVGSQITIVIPEDRLNEEPEILRRIRCGERVDHFETIRRRKNGTLVNISLTISPIRDATGRIVGASKIARDISERTRAEAQRDFLIAELSHRVKNTLATVMSIARQSFANPNTEEARRSFDARIRGLARTHSRLAEANWSGVSLDALVRDELTPYERHDVSTIGLHGPEIMLNPKCALTLGMALHELTTNAAKHGALSSKDGAVSVSWDEDPKDGTLHLQWTETGGPAVEMPTRSGFGRLLLERALASDLNGQVRLDFDRKGLKCSIAIPYIEHKVQTP